MTSFSIFPDQIDGYATLPLRKDGVHEIRADDYNRLRDAIVKIEQELGIQPSGVFATVRARLDDIGDASALITSHIANPVDAHDASAISILDIADNYISDEVEGALGELAAVLPSSLNVVGADDTSIPNTGLSNFVPQLGSLHVFTTAGANNLKNTQPVNITGIHIIEVGDENGTATAGSATLTWTAPNLISWAAPGESAGPSVDVTADADFLAGDSFITLSSDTASKKIRIARNTAVSLPATNKSDTFGILRLDAGTGAFSITGTGIEDSLYITRVSDAYGGTTLTNPQFMIGGMVFPADKGTLVVQKKLRDGSDSFTPIATLSLVANFDEDKRNTGQGIYVPSLENFDTITLFDRLPARNDYETFELNANGEQVYENFDIETTFAPQQIARYLIPMANDDIAVKGPIDTPVNISAAEMDAKISTYRIIHYKSNVTDFNGDPNLTEVFSIFQPSLLENESGPTQMGNLFVDTDPTRPEIWRAVFSPASDTANSDKYLSGIEYYNSSADIFSLEIESMPGAFQNTYKNKGMLLLSSEAVDFPSGDGYGESVSVTSLLDDGYTLYSDSNLPDFNVASKNKFFYLINASNNPDRRPYVGVNKFSTNAAVSITPNDPFGTTGTWVATGHVEPEDVRILVHSYSSISTDTVEEFVDEDYRVGTSESFATALAAGNFTGAPLASWDSTAELSVGELQIAGKFNATGLIFPQSDYTDGVRPIQSPNTPDYSTGYSGTDSIYQRLFSFGLVSNGGRLNIQSAGSSLISFDDISKTNVSRPLKIEVKVPGTGNNATGFMDIGKLFETSKTSDGDGALFGLIEGDDGDFTVPFTFGTVNTADTGYMIALRVTYFSSQFSVAKNKVLSRIELLEP